MIRYHLRKNLVTSVVEPARYSVSVPDKIFLKLHTKYLPYRNNRKNFQNRFQLPGAEGYISSLNYLRFDYLQYRVSEPEPGYLAGAGAVTLAQLPLK